VGLMFVRSRRRRSAACRRATCCKARDSTISSADRREPRDRGARDVDRPSRRAASRLPRGVGVAAFETTRLRMARLPAGCMPGFGAAEAGGGLHDPERVVSGRRRWRTRLLPRDLRRVPVLAPFVPLLRRPGTPRRLDSSVQMARFQQPAHACISVHTPQAINAKPGTRVAHGCAERRRSTKMNRVRRPSPRRSSRRRRTSPA
jgi:hypothetical protein